MSYEVAHWRWGFIESQHLYFTPCLCDFGFQFGVWKHCFFCPWPCSTCFTHYLLWAGTEPFLVSWASAASRMTTYPLQVLPTKALEREVFIMFIFKKLDQIYPLNLLSLLVFVWHRNWYKNTLCSLYRWSWLRKMTLTLLFCLDKYSTKKQFLSPKVNLQESFCFDNMLSIE